YQVKNNQPIIDQVAFDPTCKDQIYFVYLNQKRDSKEAIANFRKKQKNLTDDVSEVSNMPEELLKIQDLDTFISFFNCYDQNSSAILGTPTIQEQLFPEFDGLVKSLGGWGGDFVMVASKDNPINYFKEKGFEIIIKYQDMIL